MLLLLHALTSSPELVLLFCMLVYVTVTELPNMATIPPLSLAVLCEIELQNLLISIKLPFRPTHITPPSSPALLLIKVL